MVGTFLPDIDVFVYAALMPPPPQGDQIGRIFAVRAIVNFGECFEIYRSSANFFPRHQLCINFAKNIVIFCCFFLIFSEAFIFSRIHNVNAY
jgi:hypothetical protein